MPYIHNSSRPQYDDLVKKLEDVLFLNSENEPPQIPVGHLNYVISSICWKMFRRNPSYKRINDIIGVLECVKLEYYRRLAENYENEKMLQNGDI